MNIPKFQFRIIYLQLSHFRVVQIYSILILIPYDLIIDSIHVYSLLLNNLFSKKITAFGLPLREQNRNRFSTIYTRKNKIIII